MANQKFTIQELKNEEWRAVPGYTGSYSVSSIGRVRSECRVDYGGRKRAALILKANPRRRYLAVGLRKDGKSKTFHVHELVAAAFLGEAPSGATVNHRNGVKTKNEAANLEYCTLLQNIQHAKETGLTARGTRHAQARFSEQEVRDIRDALARGESKRSLAKRYAAAWTSIHRIGSGQRWGHLL